MTQTTFVSGGLTEAETGSSGALPRRERYVRAMCDAARGDQADLSKTMWQSRTPIPPETRLYESDQFVGARLFMNESSELKDG